MLLLCFPILVANAFAQNESPELSKLLDQFDRETQAIQKEADESVAKARRNLTKNLNALQDKLTKGGRLEEAIRVREWSRKVNGFIELKILQNPQSKDFLTAANEATIKDAEKLGYKIYGESPGLIFREQLPNTMPLMTYFHPQRKDYLTVATQEGISSSQPDYQFVRVEGYVFKARAPASIPIYLFWDGKENVTASETMQRELEKQAFNRIRIEGWIPKPTGGYSVQSICLIPAGIAGKGESIS